MTDEYICELVSHGNGQWEYEPTGQEVVRCKDCKHYLDLSFTACYLLRITCNENDFCSRGERKDEVEE